MSCSQISVTLDVTTLKVRVQQPAIRKGIRHQDKKRSRERRASGYNVTEN
jgi:hypothetical protein